MPGEFTVLGSTIDADGEQLPLAVGEMAQNPDWYHDLRAAQVAAVMKAMKSRGEPVDFAALVKKCPNYSAFITGELLPAATSLPAAELDAVKCIAQFKKRQFDKLIEGSKSAADASPNHLPTITKVLASGLRDLGLPQPSGEQSEFEYANLLCQKLPPIKTTGSTWFAYSGGAWQKISRATLRPIAQSVLPEHIRTARGEAKILDHIEGRCQVAADEFRGFFCFDDSGAVLINAQNGVVRVTADTPPELIPHSEKYMFTHRMAASLDPAAGADLFKKTLGELLPDELDQELLQLCFGNFLFPDCRYEVALVCYGEAGFGKSTISDPVTAAMGPELVTRLSMSQICDPRSYHLPKLKFAAVNLGTELDAIAIDESANFKTLVSGEPVEARPIYGEPFTMQTGCKLWFLANGLPRFKNGTDAELRRARFIRFGQRPAVKDVTLKSRLIAERDGVFNFMLEGLQRLLNSAEIPLGGAESQAVHSRFKISNDPLGAFVAQQCTIGPDLREPKTEIVSAFNGFCETHGLPAQFGDWFLKRLYERFPNLKEIRASCGGERVYCVSGIKLKTIFEGG